MRDVFLHDTGAYDPYGLTVPINSQCTLLGGLRGADLRQRVHARSSPTRPIVTPVPRRRPPARRVRDGAAARPRGARARPRPGRDPPPQPAPPDEFPHDHEILYQDFTPLVYDSGDYAPALEQAAEMIGYERFLAEEQPRCRAEGRRVGIGLVTYVEGTGIGPYEGARVTVEPTARCSVATGVGTQGQGHFTVFAQVVADAARRGGRRDVRVVTGDTREFHWGTGTFASRGAVVAGNACHAAALRVRAKVLERARRRARSAPEETSSWPAGRCGARRAGQGVDARRAGRARQPAARRGRRRHRARARGHRLLRSRPRQPPRAACTR